MSTIRSTALLFGRARVAASGVLALALLVLAGCTSSTSGSASGGSTGPTASAPASTASTSSSSAPSAPPTISPSPSASSSPSGPAGFTPTSGTFVSSDDGWVLGTAPCATAPCTSVLHTADGGASWHPVGAPRVALGRSGQATASQVTLLRFADLRDGWAAGGALYSTHDGGASWHPVSLGPAGSLVTALATGGGWVWAAVDQCPNGGCATTTTVYVSAIGADHFTALSPSLPGAVSPAELAVSGADWFVSLPTTATIYHGHAAAAPVRITGPCAGGSTGLSPAAIAAASPADLDLLCSGDGAAGSARYQLYGTTDGGAHWSAGGPPRTLESGLAAISDNGQGNLLVATESGSSRLYRTTDFGQSMPIVLDVPTGGVVWGDAGYTTSSQAFAIVDGVAFYLSHDGGATWSRVPL